MVWVPAVSELVANVATPAPSSGTGAPKSDPSTPNCTDPPVAGPPPAAVTVAVNVTSAPTVDGLRSEVSDVDVPVLFTTWSRLSTLPANMSVPRYAAAI